MLLYWVVFCDIVCQVFLSLFLEYVEMVLSDYFFDPIKYHVYCTRYFIGSMMLCLGPRSEERRVAPLRLKNYMVLKARCIPTKRHWHVELKVYYTSLCLI